jgi:2-phosphosulfolactate phosphatase
MFSQSPFACRFEWGLKGVRDAAFRGDIIIIVDVLSFSSAVVTAAHYGAKIFPSFDYESAYLFAEQTGGTVALKRDEAYGGPSLSPLSYGPSDKGRHYILPSPNGSACASSLSGKGNTLLCGSLINAESAAEKAMEIKDERSITVIACGEQWTDVTASENSLRPCLEDYLGAGAILSFLHGSKSPEASVCNFSFLSVREKLEDLIWDCGSGRELRKKGYEEDVTYCSRLNLYNTVPVFVKDHFESSEQ